MLEIAALCKQNVWQHKTLPTDLLFQLRNGIHAPSLQRLTLEGAELELDQLTS